MDKQTWKDGATYVTTLKNVVMEYAGRNDKLTTVVCMGCQTNYTPAFTEIRGDRALRQPQDLEVCLPSRIGDLFIYITCYTCAEENPKRVTDKDGVFQSYTEACKNGQEMSDTSPETNPYLYHQQTVIWGPASNLVAIL
ncbi:Conserved hypothetical protein CHP02464 [Penicillium mononematosum]|uniref:Conserved hypothetical protein CHP02464 n=1 Tax=Penicillium mononematosum TaxID=268346 RepID=UPI0025467314|nr:Conserved hypothetical protein CHP02464 [Penicillium mononematosum]KAJ6190680.1 Conserved hypothetical protein CHP02464 [Penicillium mononematosum]